MSSMYKHGVRGSDGGPFFYTDARIEQNAA
jgi:hypothetical protein